MTLWHDPIHRWFLLATAGLYGERVGALSFILSDDGAAKRVLSQLKRIARAIYSNPPVHGARIVAEVVGNEDMFTEWKQEMEGMAGRIKVCLSSKVMKLELSPGACILLASSINQQCLCQTHPWMSALRM